MVHTTNAGVDILLFWTGVDGDMAPTKRYPATSFAAHVLSRVLGGRVPCPSNGRSSTLT